MEKYGKAEMTAEFERLKGEMPPELREIAKALLDSLPDDMSGLSIDTWGDGFGAEGYLPGGRIDVMATHDTNPAENPEAIPLLALAVEKSTWGHQSQDVKNGVHFNKDQYLALRAYADQHFGVSDGLPVCLDAAPALTVGSTHDRRVALEFQGVGYSLLGADEAIELVKGVTIALAHLAGMEDAEEFVDGIKGEWSPDQMAEYMKARGF